MDEYLKKVAANLSRNSGPFRAPMKHFPSFFPGTQKYIPFMKEAKLLKVYPGIIVTEGTVDLDELDSDVHSRDYSGVKEVQIGWIDNACMKLLYCYKNGEEVLGLILKQQAIDQVLMEKAKNSLEHAQNRNKMTTVLFRLLK